MIDGPTVVAALEAVGFTHLVWIPDSHLGTWDAALAKSPEPDAQTRDETQPLLARRARVLASRSGSKLPVIRPCREGEAIGIAAGLMLGGAKPLVAIQCTGFFEAGDAVRNAVHDLKLPLKLLIGVRSWRAMQAGKSGDNCPHFAEPMVKAWDLPSEWFDPFSSGECESALRRLAEANEASVLLWGE